MAKIWQISDGRSYVVNGDPGTTITYTNSPSNGTAAGKQATSIPAGATSVTFPSNGSEVEISSDTATIDQVFNVAAAGSGSSSSGSGSAGGVTFQIVTTLPSQGAAGVIYLVKVSETGDDKFEEWIWVDSAWESIGTTAVDPTTYAKLIGGNTFEGNQVINGDLTVTGDVSGVVENSYYLTETIATTITPRAGTWTRYTGFETALTIEEPAWTGEVDLAYLETSVPVTLTGVTWSPAEPVLTGDGPFVYTLVHSKEGEVLAGAYGYSVATAEAVQAVVPMAWSETSVTFGEGASNARDSGVVLGAGASASGANNVIIGEKAFCSNANSVVVGKESRAVGESVSAGYNASTLFHAAAVGHGSYAANDSIALGYYARGEGGNNVSIGSRAASSWGAAVTIGAQFTEAVNGQNVTHTCTTEGTGSITIGAGANTLNNGDTESSNSVTIGCKALNQGADSVVLGALSSNEGAGNVVIGGEAVAKGTCNVNIGYKTNKMTGSSNVAIGYYTNSGDSCVSIGSFSTAGNNSTSIGRYSYCNVFSVSLGEKARAEGAKSVAIGANAKVADNGATVIRSTAADDTYTQLYFAGANTPLANTYEDGEAMMGYVTMQKGADGQFAPVAAGTQKLSVLFPNNSGFQPMALSLDDDMTPPKVFPPSDLDMPQEEPTEPEEYQPLPVWPIVEPEIEEPAEEPQEPEDITINIPEPTITEPEPYTPLPVYPIVEPEDSTANIPEQEPYTPLPVYPIVEPEVPEIVEEPTE